MIRKTWSYRFDDEMARRMPCYAVSDDYGVIAFTHSADVARLIAAVPDLLAACERLLDYAQDCAAAADERPACIEFAAAAIAKARGQ